MRTVIYYWHSDNPEQVGTIAADLATVDATTICEVHCREVAGMTLAELAEAREACGYSPRIEDFTETRQADGATLVIANDTDGGSLMLLAVPKS